MCNKAISFAKRNIGNIAFIILSRIIYLIFLDDNNYKLIFNIGQSKMIAIVVAIFTLLTYINDFVIKNTIDSNKKSNYYLGYNIKNYNLYQKAGFKIYASQNLGFFLILMVLIPAALIFTKFNYNLKAIIYLSNLILRYSKFLLAAWCSLLLVTIQYILLILYTIIIYSKDTFYSVYNLDFDYNTYDIAKEEIEDNISRQFKNEIIKLLNNAKVSNSINFVEETKKLTKYIFDKARFVSNNKEDFNEFLMVTFLYENKTVMEFIDKAEDKSSRISIGVDYFLSKWDNTTWISIVCISPSFVIINAINNLKVINDIHEICVDKNICENNLYSKGKIKYQNKNYETSNILVTEIINLIGMCFSDKVFIEGLTSKGDIFKFFTTICDMEIRGSIERSDLEIYLDYLLYNLYAMSDTWDGKTKEYIYAFEYDVKIMGEEILQNKINEYNYRFIDSKKNS